MRPITKIRLKSKVSTLPARLKPAKFVKCEPKEKKEVVEEPIKPAGPSRPYAKAVFIGYKRGLKNHTEDTALLKIEGVNSNDEARYFIGKKCAFVYRIRNKNTIPKKRGMFSKSKIIWGRVTRTYGNSGKVRARFQLILPSKAIDQRIRIKLQPQFV